MLSGDNGILQRATDAKIQTEKGTLKESIMLAYNASMIEKMKNQETDFTETMKKELEKEYGKGKVSVKKSGKRYTVKVIEKGIYKIEDGGNIREFIPEDRTEIKIGDYVKYISPTSEVKLSTDETGYTKEQILQRKEMFRVLSINKDDGSIELIGEIELSDGNIFLKGAKGYNNSVYILNKKCNDLYSDTEKGIIARSIKEEDITDRFNRTGKEKITNYITTEIGKLSKNNYITDKDIINKTITYKTRTYYPDIFQYEKYGKIDGTETSGIVSQSESFSGYNGLTKKESSKATTSLTMPYTYYNSNHDENDFEDTTNKSKFQSMFFEARTTYWLASRFCILFQEYAGFGIRQVNYNAFMGGWAFFTHNASTEYDAKVAPIVFLDGEVKIQTHSGTKDSPHIVQ